MTERKFAPRTGTETRASWNNPSKLQEPKGREIILEPEHETEEPSAVRCLTPEEVEEAGAGNTETEALESTRKRQEDSLSTRYTREDLVEPAGRENVSICQPTSFPTRNRGRNIFGPDQHDSGDTSREKANLNSGRLNMELGIGKGKGQE